MLSYLLCCFKWNFSGIFFPFFVLSNQCGLSCLKKSVLPLKNFSFIIKSTAPSNIKCLKNVLTSQSGFLIVFSTHLKKKLSFFFLICIFQRQKKNITVSINKNPCSMYEKFDTIFMGLFLLLIPQGQVHLTPVRLSCT